MMFETMMSKRMHGWVLMLGVCGLCLGLQVGCSDNTCDCRNDATTPDLGGSEDATAADDAASNRPDMGECVAITEDITTDTTLTADQCYLVEGDIDATAALTLDPGVIVYFGANASLSLERDGGALIANGSAASPIILTGVEPVAGYWKGVSLESNNPLNSIKFVTIEYGGGERVSSCSSSLPANLSVGGCGSAARVTIEDCTFRHGVADGLIVVNDDDDISPFARNACVANGGAPVRLDVDRVADLDLASDFVGEAGMENAEPNIVVTGAGWDLNVDSTWPDHGLPYRIEDDELELMADLTLSPGVTLIFPEDGRLIVDEDGSLNAVGTAAKPITFTSSTEVAGYWRGILVESSNPLNVLEHVDIGYGGREKIWNSSAGVPANIMLKDAPARLELKNSNIHDSLGWGVYVYDDGNLTSESNTFANNEQGDVGP